jgi:hypothetical protein
LETGRDRIWDLVMVEKSERGSGFIVPPVSIKDRPLLLISSPVTELIIPCTYLLMGAGRLVTHLSGVPALSGPA